MNCEKARQDLLLEQSGELSNADRAGLSNHLAACQACRQVRSDIARTTRLAREFLPQGIPSSDSLDAVLRAVRSQRPARIIRFQRPAFHILAWAAALTLAVAGWLLFAPGSVSTLNHVDDVSSLVAMATDGPEPAAQISDTHETRLQALAEELLKLEGFTSESCEPNLMGIL